MTQAELDIIIEQHRLWQTASKSVNRTEFPDAPAEYGTRATCLYAQFVGLDFRGANLAVSIFRNCTFIECNLAGVNFTMANLEGAKFVNTDTSNTNFSKAILNDVENLECDKYTCPECNLSTWVAKPNVIDRCPFCKSELSERREAHD
jgi:uncharacterized protein YjbI with pentapeptide repeats